MPTRLRALPASFGIIVPGLLIFGLTVRHHSSHAVERVALPSPRAALITATPFPTPRPTATPVVRFTARSHVRTGGISYPLSQLRELQAAADRGDRARRYALSPVTVTLHDLPRFGFKAGVIELLSPAAPQPAPTAHTGEDGRPETDVIVRFHGRQYWIVLNQFVRYGPGGIWSVITITPIIDVGQQSG